MSLEPNKVVQIEYTLKDKEGNVLDSTQEKGPFSFISGNNQIIPKLEEKIGEMLIGTEKKVELEPKEAYGEYQNQAVQTVKKDDFPDDAEIKPGMSYVANSPDGKQMPFVIKEVKEEDVVLDFNHPLAGKSLEFDVKLIDQRDATPEEISHGHVHGKGGVAH